MTTSEPAAPRSAVLLDLDGVVWLAHQPIPGSVEAIAALRAAGHRILFVTNNSAPRVETHEQALATIGVPAEGDVLTSSMAAALLVSPGEKVLVCGGEGIVQALERRGATIVDDGDCDAVMVGLNRGFDYEILRRAASAVAAGARLIGTNDDATYPTPDGPIPGGGAILAAVRVASGAIGEVAGKPHQPMALLVRTMLGDDAAAGAVMVGDRPETDGLFARRLGCRYAQVWSGVTAVGTLVSPTPDLVADDLAAVASSLLAGGDGPCCRAPHGYTGAMPQNPLKRLLDAGVEFTTMSQATAERLVGDFVKAGEVQRSDAARTVQSLVDRGRQSTEHLVQLVQAEIAKQLARFADRFDDLEDRLEELAETVGTRMGLPTKRGAARKKSTASATTVAAKKAAAKAKKTSTTAKKTAAKKVPAAKKAAAKKSTAKKSTAAKKAASS